MSPQTKGIVVFAIYLASATLFIFGLRMLSRVKTARAGNGIAGVAMLLAVIGTLLELHDPPERVIEWPWIVIGLAGGGLVGAIAAYRVPMTSMPEMVAIFNGSGGLSSMLVALSVHWKDYVEADREGTVTSALGADVSVTAVLSVLIGAITFTGSVIAFLKLNGMLRKGNPILLPGRHVINALLAIAVVGTGVWYAFFAAGASDTILAAIAVSAISLVLGVTLVIPIGGADMPVIVSLLNSYSGVAACTAGFVIGNPLLIIAGAMVGAAGLILTQIMCVAMNRSLANVLLGGFGATEAAGSAEKSEYVNVKSCGPEEAAMLLENARSVVFVPGYGLAVAQAQHAARELGNLMQARGAKVTYAIHPVAGRMPGHMNVLLAEADVPYEQLVEMDAVNPELRDTDVVIVLGANDVVNPVAATDPKSPLYGMPIIECHRARSVFVVKRSLGAGYAGVKNELFEYENTMMIFGDAKKVLQSLATELTQLSS